MGLDPITLSAIISGASMLGSSLLGGSKNPFKGEELNQQAMIPPGFEGAFEQAGQMAQQGMNQPTYIPQLNQSMLAGYSIPLQYYMGMSPGQIQIPGIMPFSPFGTQPSIGAQPFISAPGGGSASTGGAATGGGARTPTRKPGKGTYSKA
jgi:hypothetical protein